MGYYVYQYLHPEYGHLYCGRADNLDSRIYQHNNLSSDNIPREYEHLLKESVIMYIELQNKAQGIAVEAYCIDKFKPFINKALKYDDGGSLLEMKLPKWKMYDVENLNYKHHLHSIKKEKEQLIDSIVNIENEIDKKSNYLSNAKTRLKKINYEIKTHAKIESENIIFDFDIKDIKWFYSHCENKDVKFYSEIYDKVGNIVGSGVLYYDSQSKLLVLERDQNKFYSNNICFDIFCSALYSFYPDIDIYPELYAALLSNNEELKVKNKIYDIDTLLNKYNDSCFASVDDSIRVISKNKKIFSCNIRDDSLNNGTYSWNLKDGEEYIEDCIVHYKKADLNKKIKERIYSSKYYAPDANLEDGKYCEKMLLKYSA